MFKDPSPTLVGGIELIDSDAGMPAPSPVVRGGGDPVAAIPCGTGMVLMDHGIWKEREIVTISMMGSVGGATKCREI